MGIPTATYRLQLRDGMDFAAAAGVLPHVAGLGASHLYLSPIFQAVSGSTHGYDVTRPDRFEPTLGGRAGFTALATEARRQGIGIILDIVPNHTAFSPENPWLRDVLRHGRDSRYAGHFDIDWSRGRLVLPFLSQPLDDLLQAGKLRVEAEDGDDLSLTDGAFRLPLAATGEAAAYADPRALRDLLAAQHWSLTHDSNGLTHRRFFNVTGLIGMRVEEAQVFQDMHALIFELVEAGEVQGLRIDHIDGLADPTAYLHRLRQRLPDTPLWVEKILTGSEDLPDWPVLGTTGYEAGRAIARVLTDAPGLARLEDIWRTGTGQRGSFDSVLTAAKADMLAGDLAPELSQLTGLARAALPHLDDATARAAMHALLTAFPRYRTYLSDTIRPAQDVALMADVAHRAAQDVADPPVVRALADCIVNPSTAAARKLRVRFQQVTGALLAKAHEDTACYRWTCYLASSEVGADPAQPWMSPQAFTDWMAHRAATQPQGLTLTSSHDTKRAEDARMRLTAISHRPEAFAALWRQATTLPEAAACDPALAWYIVQTVLAAWQPDRADLADRLATHVEKAMREAKQVTTWSSPDPEAERGPILFAQALLRVWDDALPDAARELMAVADHLSLRQLVLKLLMPGVPDIYQGAEAATYRLTDPDNRAGVDVTRLPGGGFNAVKLHATRHLLRLRRENPAFFATAATRLTTDPDGGMMIERRSGTQVLTVRLPPATTAPVAQIKAQVVDMAVAALS